MPHSERLETFKVLHLEHDAVNKMQLRGLEIVYWPRINKDILKQYQSCKICIKYSKSKRSEPLQSNPTPEVPWHTVATGLFKTKNSKYLLIGQHYIQSLSPGYESSLCQTWSPKHYHIRWWVTVHIASIGKLNTESHSQGTLSLMAWQTMKASLIKTIEEGEDVNLALLIYKTTPLNHRPPSPAELLNSKKYKTLFPTRIVPTRLHKSYRQIMGQRKQLQAQLYNKNSRVLLRIQQSQKVVVQLNPDKNIWTPVEIIQCLTNEGRSYSPKTKHRGAYIRNRRFIKPDLTEVVLPEPRPEAKLRMARLTRTMKELGRLTESKNRTISILL